VSIKSKKRISDFLESIFDKESLPIWSKKSTSISEVLFSDKLEKSDAFQFHLKGGRSKGRWSAVCIPNHSSQYS
jgi:hypothetical protein